MQTPPLTLISRMMDSNFQSMFSSDSSSLDPMFSGVSLHSLLTLNPSLFADYTMAFLTDDPQPLNIVEPTETPLKLEDKKNLLVPKNEHPHLPTSQELATSSLTTSHHPQLQPFNFFPKYQSQPPHFYDDPSAFHRLPELRSVERHAPEPSYTDQKRLRIESVKNWSHPTAVHHTSPPVGGKAPSVIPQSNLARQRRQKLSEKTRCLQKLMPWDKKMDQATLLEEAYKYVKFLQAQFCVLQSMPSHTDTFPFLMSTTTTTTHNGDPKFGAVRGVFGDLERLNRNQVLQVLVNSPVAQTMLYSQGLCVFSVEQLALLRKLSERRLLLQQMMMSDHASSKPFFN